MNENVASFLGYPRPVPRAAGPLGLYFRLGRNDHPEFLNLLTTGQATCFGTVFDPTLLKRHRELRDQVLNHHLDAILDPKTQQSATIGGFNEALGALPWGVGRPHTVSDFQGVSGRRVVSALCEFVLEHRFTQVLSPTHLLRSAHDQWLDVDIEATQHLRDELDRQGGAKVPIVFSLALTYSMLRDPEQRWDIISALRTIPASAIWLKIDGFGSDSSPAAVRAYIEATRDFHTLGLPIISDHVGGLIGLSLLSFGATGGLSHGVTLSERFHSGNWRRPPTSKRFGQHQRVYVPKLDLLLKPTEARALLQKSSRTRAMFGCNDTHCCPRGIPDMIERPGHHFLYQRIKEVSDLGKIPQEIRPQVFLERHLRPAADHAVAAANIQLDDSMAKKMREQRKRLDALRVALGHLVTTLPSNPYAFVPKTRSARDTRNARL